MSPRSKNKFDLSEAVAQQIQRCLQDVVIVEKDDGTYAIHLRVRRGGRVDPGQLVKGGFQSRAEAFEWLQGRRDCFDPSGKNYPFR